MATCGDLTVLYGANELDKLIQNFEFENQQYVKLIEKENQLIEALEKEEDEKRSEILRLQEETSRLDEDTKKAHKQFTHNRDHCESLKKTGVVLMEHELALSRKLNSVICNGEAEKQERQNVLKQYQTIYLDYERKYKTFPRVQKFLTLQEEIGERERVITQEDETVKNLQQQIEEAQGNDEVNFKDLNEFIFKLVQLKVDSEKVLSQIKLFLDEKSNLEKELTEIREKQTQNVDQLQETGDSSDQELCERTKTITMQDERSESLMAEQHKTSTAAENRPDSFVDSTDPDSMEVEMRDNEPPVNGIPMSAVTSQNTSVSVSSERDHKQQLSVKMTDFQLSIQPHDGVYKGYMNKNRNNVNAGDTPDMTNRFPFIEKPQLTVKQQITDIHQQTMGIPQLTTSIPQQTATNQQETTSFQQQTTAFQQHTNIQQQTTSIQQQTTSIQQQTTAIQQQTTNILPQPNDKQQQKTNVRQVAPQMSATTGRETRQIPTLLVPNLFTPPSPMQKTFQSFKSMKSIPKLIQPSQLPRVEPQSPLSKPQPVPMPVTPRPVSAASSGLLARHTESESQVKVPLSGNQQRFAPPDHQIKVPLLGNQQRFAPPDQQIKVPLSGNQQRFAPPDHQIKVPLLGNQQRFAPPDHQIKVPLSGNQQRFAPPTVPSIEKPKLQVPQLTSSTPLPRFMLPTLPDRRTNLPSKQPTPSPVIASPIPIQKEVQQEPGSSQKTTNAAPAKSPTSRRMPGNEEEDSSLPKTPKSGSDGTKSESRSPFDLEKHRQKLENFKSKSPGGPTFTSRPMFECETGQMETQDDNEPSSFFHPFCKDMSDSPGRMSNPVNIFTSSSPVPGTTMFNQIPEQNSEQEMQTVNQQNMPSMSLFGNKQSSPQTAQSFESGFFSLFGQTPASPQPEETSFSFGFGGQETTESPKGFSFSFGGDSNNDNNSSSVFSLF